MTKEEYLDSVCKFCCERCTCCVGCVGTEHFHPCKTYITCVECWNESAKQQRIIDIDKAWEWILWMFDTQSATPDFIEESRIRFTKAMDN